MNILTELIYSVVVLLIRLTKFLIFWILFLLTPTYKWLVIERAKSIGVVFDFTDNGNDADSQFLSTENYDRVLHVKVNKTRIFARFITYGLLGLAEGYIDGDFHLVDNRLEDITEGCVRAMDKNIFSLYDNFILFKFFHWLEISAFNLQTNKRAWKVAEEHYDLGNDLFEVMLGPWMQYNCGYWKNASDLEKAQIDNLDLIAKKLNLQPGMRVLDLGCGWGTLCKYLAENYQVECVGVTVGKEGADFARRITQGLPIEIRVQDYRSVNEKFDRIVCVEMLMHVGYKNHRTFFNVVRQCLKDDGIFVMQCIGRNANMPRMEQFAHRYIFPNTNLATAEQIAIATRDLLIIEDWHNFGSDFVTTFDAWITNFVNGWPRLAHKGERFYKLWTLYLACSKAYFKARKYHLWQIVLSRDGLRSNYRAAR